MARRWVEVGAVDVVGVISVSDPCHIWNTLAELVAPPFRRTFVAQSAFCLLYGN